MVSGLWKRRIDGHESRQLLRGVGGMRHGRWVGGGSPLRAFAGASWISGC